MKRAAAPALAALVAGACAQTVPAVVPLADTWPQPPPRYGDAYDRWTRRGLDRDELSQTIGVSATLESADFRAAYLHERARRLQIPPDEEARLAEAEQKALGDAWELELLVATAKPELNDLRKYGKERQEGKTGSSWRLALVGDAGREVVPISVVEDRRHREDVHAYFPDLQQFYVPYIVKFPRRTADGQPLVQGKGKLTLKVGGALGQVTLVWDGG